MVHAVRCVARAHSLAADLVDIDALNLVDIVADFECSRSVAHRNEMPQIAACMADLRYAAARPPAFLDVANFAGDHKNLCCMGPMVQAPTA